MKRCRFIGVHAKRFTKNPFLKIWFFDTTHLYLPFLKCIVTKTPLPSFLISSLVLRTSQGHAVNEGTLQGYFGHKTWFDKITPLGTLPNVHLSAYISKQPLCCFPPHNQRVGERREEMKRCRLFGRKWG